MREGIQVWRNCPLKTIKPRGGYTEPYMTWREEWIITKPLPKRPRPTHYSELMRMRKMMGEMQQKHCTLQSTIHTLTLQCHTETTRENEGGNKLRIVLRELKRKEREYEKSEAQMELIKERLKSRALHTQFVQKTKKKVEKELEETKKELRL